MHRLSEEMHSIFRSNPKEIVILDFQHAYAMSGDDRRSVTQLLEDTFGSKICPTLRVVPSLNYLIRYEYQVIIVSEQLDSLMGIQKIWPRRYCPNPWADTDDRNELQVGSVPK